ncbi:MAG: hypothetical protein MUC49_21425 [Raineya sp.]|jgi:hypothetical protein|nr:hypothetical protein [Raineya sp.]
MNDNYQKHEIQLVMQLLTTIKSISWNKAILHIENDGSGNYGYTMPLYDKNDIEIKYGLRAFDREEDTKLNNIIGELTLLPQERKWNKADFTVYPDGSYESTYSWDNEKDQQDYYINCVATINWLYERLAEYVGMLQTNNFTKKVKRIQECKFTIDKKGDFFYISGYAHFEGLKLNNIIFEPVQEPKEENETKRRLSSAYIQDLLNNLHKDTHEDFLKDKWVISTWNHISMNITPLPMVFEQDIKFEFKPENFI